MKTRILGITIGIIFIFASLGLAQAQDWPTKTVRIIVGFSPGGSSDLAARLLASGIGEEIGGKVIVENKPGAGATIGAAYVTKSKPDGHTIYLSNVTANSIATSTYKNLPYDPVKDFDEITTLGLIAAVFLANPEVPVNSIKELVAYVKARPNEVNFGSGGHGTMNHLVGELLNIKAGLTLNHIAYKGSAQAMNDLLAGVIPFQVDALTQNVGQIKSGVVRALAITTPERSPQAPDVPTFSELGYPDIVALNWVGLSAPAKTPRAIINKLSKAVNVVMQQPKIIDQFNKWGMKVATNSPEEAEAFVAGEVKKWREVVSKSKAFN